MYKVEILNLKDHYKDKIILVTGGTGTIGSEIVEQLLKFEPKTIRILSNSENELWETRLRFKDHLSQLRFLLGDIRNLERIRIASENVDYIFNAAAIKHVPISEYNPMEASSVNIFGLSNVIDAAYYNNVKKMVHISTDKAINPTTVMGATKMIGERLCLSREMTKGTHNTTISCVRFGNVLGSRGSIIPLIKDQIKNEDYVTLTDEKMKRFFLSISDAIGLVLKSATLSKGGEIFVLKMPVILIKDLIEVIIEEYCPKIGKDPSTLTIITIGPRIKEKLDEELISPIEFSSCYETDDMYIIYPHTFLTHDITRNKIDINGSKIVDKNEFLYNTKHLPTISKEEIRNVLNKNNLI
ncbi:MAG: SDR family NAD(P)-dependent oxidoreductase [Candidatus Lokiarchaeota archaeon]|nr:SDR family NAD(P)-dependent oxidoreductase [Candidatus Lokiarchaeota archaeon]